MNTIRRILWPTDFSEQAQRALPYVNGLARQFSARVDVIHVLPSSVPMASMVGHAAAAMTEALKSMDEHARETIGEVVDGQIADDIVVTSAVMTGSAAHEIASYAQAQSIDLIILATHGETGLVRLVSGSVAEKVVRLAPCPVLSVPPSSDDGQ